MELSAPGIAFAAVALVAVGFGLGVAWEERKAGRPWIEAATFGLIAGPFIGGVVGLIVLGIQELV